MKRLLLCAFLLTACGSSSSETTSDDTTASDTTSPDIAEPTETSGDERPSMTADECTAAGGTMVGDIGDGAIHRPEYRCENGQPPIASVPLGIEGSVCCGP